MDEKELHKRALLELPHKKSIVDKYFNLLSWVKHYEKLMEHPDSPWVCSGYNNAVANLEHFCEKNPDIVQWLSRRAEQGSVEE